MELETVNGRIVVQADTMRFESRMTFGAAFMMFGAAVITIGIPIFVISAFPQGLLALPLAALWYFVVWRSAYGRFGTFVVDRKREELRTDDGTVIAPLDRLRFYTVFDFTDGTHSWTGRNHWLTAKAPGIANVYRLGKMSSEDADRVLTRLRAWGCNAQ
jgi:hypothetical protein